MKEKQSNYRIIENVIDTANGEVKTYHIQKQYVIFKFKFWLNYFPLVQDSFQNYYLIKCPSLKLRFGSVSHHFNSLVTVETMVNFLKNDIQNYKYSGIKITPFFYYNTNELKIKYFIKKYSTYEYKGWKVDNKFNDLSGAKSYIDSKMKTVKNNVIRTSVFERKTI